MNNQTKRVSVSSIEEILYDIIPVLDHGFIRVIDYMGDDSSIVQAARVSYGRGTKKSLQDKGLINYLMRHRHTTPFEMCDIKFHIKLPIFIARQWIRHRTASINEYSARYSILSNEFYVPAADIISPQSKINKQGRDSDNVISNQRAREIMDIIISDSTRCYNGYLNMLNEDESGNIIDESKVGLTRELARMNLTLNHYTEWYWKINLHNLMHFVALRADNHAQYEIRAYASKILDIMKLWVPYSHEAFVEHRMNSVNLSGSAVKIIQKMINGEDVDQVSSGLSKREWSEVMNVFSQKR
ncbi:MAG TPA: FAD-dependent thymidylate synthase [Candidatus Megaira endosymbiont of Hartmannula sinica]|nr:FAD-dependent thymidylate synthase [Candidatus Megaera endosymbiont of Hartmannula sinica]